jgi:hypothetical protein
VSRKFPGRRLAKDNDGAYYSFLALRNGWEYRIAIARVDPYHLDAVPPAAAFNTGFPGSPRSAVGVGVPSTGKPIRS